jgi:hypothetical protein
MAALLIYSTVSLIRLKRKLVGAILLRDNIYLADHIDSPFVMGQIRPKIYLPSSLAEKERDYILLHEEHHIRRGDHVVKLLSFIALCLHCFNPLVWIAFILSGKDMEMSCDEAVLRKLGGDIRADYSASLISLATGRRIIAGTPLAFGEGNTEGRIKNIAKWKKPAVWVIVVAVIVCVVLAVCLITNPMNRDTMLLGAEYRIAETLYNTGDNDYSDNDQPSVCITADYGLWEWHGDENGKWRLIGQLEPYALTKKELAELYPNIQDPKKVKFPWRLENEKQDQADQRIGQMIDDFLKNTEGDIFVVCHGGILSSVIREMQKRGSEFSRPRFNYNCCLYSFTFDTETNRVIDAQDLTPEFMPSNLYTDNLAYILIPPKSKVPDIIIEE